MNVLDLKPGIWRISKKDDCVECNYLCVENEQENIKALSGFVFLRSDLRSILEKELPKIMEDNYLWIDSASLVGIASKVTMLIKSLIGKGEK